MRLFLEIENRQSWMITGLSICFFAEMPSWSLSKKSYQKIIYGEYVLRFTTDAALQQRDHFK